MSDTFPCQWCGAPVPSISSSPTCDSCGRLWTKAYQAGREFEREECARVVELFSINKTSVHPNLTWDQMSKQAQAICHTTCQQLAAAIRALKGKP